MPVRKDASRRPRHAGKPIPFELIQHTGIFFEEKLYTQALNLLQNILLTGTVSHGPLFTPSPQHLALAASFLVHPSTTTRAKTAEEKEAAGVALRLLRLTYSLLGPVTAKFDIAFTFTHFESSRHGNRRRRADEDEDGSLPGKEGLRDGTRPLNLELGQSASVWSRAEDFWHAVGWAFNCSVLHPERWVWWRLWLEFMCEVLEDDWNERSKQVDAESEENCDDDDDDDDGYEKKKKQEQRKKQILESSLISRYIIGGSAGSGRNRRILRAIFADGTTGAVNEFRQVFPTELKPLKQDQEGSIKKREAEVNIDEEEYGDYLTKDEDDDEEGDSTSKEDNPEQRRSKRPRRSARAAQSDTTTATTIQQRHQHNPRTTYTHETGLSLLGGLTSLTIRQRLLQLLTTASEALPESFIPLDDLYYLFLENIRHLPLPIYQTLLCPLTLHHFVPSVRKTLAELLIYRLRETGAPDTQDEYLNQSKLERCYLPFAASTATALDNARLSIALEALVMLLAVDEMLVATEGLIRAVREGIVARVDKAQVEVRRNQVARSVEDVEWAWLIESGDRLLFVVSELLPWAQGEGERENEGGMDVIEC